MHDAVISRTLRQKKVRTGMLPRLMAVTALGASGWILAGGLGGHYQLTQSASAQAPDDGERRGGERRGGEGRGGERRGGEGRGGEGRGGEGRGGRGGQWFGGEQQRGRSGMRGAPGMRDIQEQLQPDFMRRDLPLFVDQLAMDDAQTLVLETLFDDYEGDYETRSAEVQDQLRSLSQQMFQTMMSPQMREQMGDRMRSIRDELDEIAAEQGELSREERSAIFRQRLEEMQEEMQAERAEQGLDRETQAAIKEIFDLFEEWTIEKAVMRERFVEGLKAQLNDDQLAVWPAFDRFLVREKSLPKSRLSGEGTNLFLVIDEYGLDDDSFDRLEPLFDEYEVALHESLVSRDRFLEISAPKLYKALQSGDKDEARRIVDRQIDYRKSVRNVNDEYIQTFAAEVSEIDEGTGSDFGLAMRKEAYERIYRPTRTQRAFDTAMEFDLDPDVRTAVLDLYSIYMNELNSMNSKLVNLVRKQEPDQQVQQIDRMSAFIEGNFMSAWGNRSNDDDDDPVDEAYERRGELDEEYFERLESLLTPEQLEELPRRGGRRGRGGGEGRGGDRLGGGGWSGNFDINQMPEEVRQRIIDRFDTDGDGELSEEETEQIRERFRGGGGGPGSRGGGGGGPV